MRFGGHQTFYLREGWLHKGLKLLLERPEALVDEFAFDHLGVGRNMASSIRHWLQATCLAVKPATAATRSKDLSPTDFARILWQFDKYFTMPQTWWFLHINLVANRAHAESWFWFFNHFGLDRFDRETCLRRAMKYVKELPGNPPMQETLERDLSCLINTYAVEVPNKVADPEDDIACPFRELELLVMYKATGHIHLQRRRRSIDPFVLMYAMGKCLDAHDRHLGLESSSTVTDARFFDLVRLPNNPMRLLVMHTDAFYELLVETERAHPELGLHVIGLAGDRHIRIARRPAIEWVSDAFEKREATA